MIIKKDIEIMRETSGDWISEFVDTPVKQKESSKGLNNAANEESHIEIGEKCKKKIMGWSKDTSDIKNTSHTSPLRSCILIPKGDDSDEKVAIKKAKSVHFADSLGKPLMSVKTLLEHDESIDLTFLSLKSTTRRTFPVDIFKRNSRNYGIIGGTDVKTHNKLLNFQQPVKTKDFQSRVEKENVCLENVVFREYGIFATIAVNNISYYKEVTVRYTLDKWKTFKIIKANYVPGSSTGITDTFSFEISPEDAQHHEVEIEFAICYAANESTYWDSNGGKNYIVSYKVQNSKKDDQLIDTDSSNTGFVLPRQNFIGWST